MLAAGIGAVVCTGCKSFDEYQAERQNKAVLHFERSQYSNIDKNKVFTLNECFHYAKKNNLDLQVFGIEEKVAQELRTSEMLGMLPELNVSNNLTRRDNTPASKSRQLDS